MTHPIPITRSLALGLWAVLTLTAAGPLTAQTAAPPSDPGAPSFSVASDSVHRQLKDALDELATLQQRIAEETIPLSRQLGDLEDQLTRVRQDFQQTSRLLDSRTLDLSNLKTEIEARDKETAYLSTLLNEYLRNFESRLHIAELQRYHDPLEKARLAVENPALTREDLFAAQAGLLSLSLDRMEDALGGAAFDGQAVDASGRVHKGRFLMIGPTTLFRSADGSAVGNADQRLGSLEPAIIAFDDPADRAAADALLTTGKGQMPFDPSLGNAHKIQETQDTFLEHIQKGGPVMVPIFVLAGAALLVALYKWVALSLVRLPRNKRVKALIEAVAARDQSAAMHKARAVGGPTGRMLLLGAEHLKEPRELIEEVMYESMLSTRLKLQRFLPFIAITASAAPLLGLLGTVTGIMNTFRLITVFGTGDVKTLSSGISEALITTEYGLIVAIPSLLLYAFLSRKARGVIDQMEKAAVAFLNQVSRTPMQPVKDDQPAAANPEADKKPSEKSEGEKAAA